MKYICRKSQLPEVWDAIEDSDNIIAIDTEFTDLNPHKARVLIIVIGTKHEQFVIDAIKLSAADLCSLVSYLEDPTIIKIGHNLSADYKIIYKFLNARMKNMYDTMLAEKLIYAGILYKDNERLGFTLRDLAERYKGITLDKEVRSTFINFQGNDFTQEQIEYAGHDVAYLFDIREKQLAILMDLSLMRVCDLEMSIIDVTASMEYHGVYINKNKLESMVEPFERFIQAADQAFQDMFISAGVVDTISLTSTGYYVCKSSSSDQVLELLRRVGITLKNLDSKTVMKWDFKNSKASDDNFDYSAIIDDPEVAEALESYKVLNNPYLRAHAFIIGAKKILSTYVHGILKAIHEESDRVYPFFNQLGAAATGRYSSNGPNFQNLPNDSKLKDLGLDLSLRECIEAPEGRKLIIADYSGVELVILAILSGDKKLLYEITQGDIHTQVTREVLKYTDITLDNKKKQPHKQWRDAAKKLSYSIAYGTTGQNVSDFLNLLLGNFGFKINKQEGDQLIEAWFTLFPDTAAYLHSSAEKAIMEGYVCDTWGRRRNWNRADFVNKWRRLAAGREGMNAPIQGTSATMTKRAMYILHNKLDARYAAIIFPVHDEIVVECADAYVSEAKKLIKYSMEQAIRETLPAIAHMVGDDRYESFCVVPKESNCYDK